MNRDNKPNIDGDDYEAGGKYFFYRGVLLSIPGSLNLPEDIKARRIETLKSEIIPFWHRCLELHERESEELMAIFLKYNGPNGIRKRYSEELKEMKTRISDADDGILFEHMENFRANPTNRPGDEIFDYGARGKIYYRLQQEVEEDSESDVTAKPGPAINLVPFGGGLDGVPHHHNMNPADDHSLNATLLDVLHRLMNDENGKPFIKEAEGEDLEQYLETVERPRHLKFIEKGLRSDKSIGYGATAFFNDMRLLFVNNRVCEHTPGNRECAINLEVLMKKLLAEMGDVGEQLLTQYDAITSQGLESWPDPELIYLIPGHNPHLPGYERDPDVGGVRIAAREQFRRGQERVQELRTLLSRRAPSVEQSSKKLPVAGEAQLHGESRKRPRDEEEEEKAADNDLNRAPKRHRSVRSASPGPSNPSHVRSRRAAANRRPTHSADITDADGTEVYEGRGSRSSTQQRLVESSTASGNPAPSSEDTGSASEVVPASRAPPKRGRTPDDDGSESGDVEAGDGRGPAGSKRRRLIKGSASASLSIAGPQAGPVNPRRATPEPGDIEPGSAQSHLTSPAGQPTPQPAEYPAQYGMPSSTFLKFSRNSITMSKIAKMGKKRPWLFSYKTAEGYGIYAFVKCPAGNCKHHFSSHPLRKHRAQDHILACGQQIRDQRDMVRQYARQVIKDDGRKSDLTIDWARKSNTHLLPSEQQENHPDNFPVSLVDE